MSECAGCNHIESSPVQLLSGSVVCSTCSRYTEQQGAILRHVLNLFRVNGRAERSDYMDRIAAAEGQKMADAVKAEFLREWEKIKGSSAP